MKIWILANFLYCYDLGVFYVYKAFRDLFIFFGDVIDAHHG